MKTFVARDGESPFVTSARLELKGAPEHVTIWVLHHCVGNLIFGEGDGERFLHLLDLVPGEVAAWPT